MTAVRLTPSLAPAVLVLVVALISCGENADAPPAGVRPPAVADAPARSRAQRAADLRPVPARTLDARPPRAIAVDQRRVAWIRPRGRGQSLVVRDRPEGGNRVVVRRLPVRVTRLALGTDARGVPTAVLATGGAPDPDVAYAPTRPDATGALYAVALRGSARVRLLPVSRAAGAEHAPGLLHGALSFARTRRVRGGGFALTVETGTLDGGASRVLWRGPSDRPVIATAIGAGGRVAFTTHATPGAVDGWSLILAGGGSRTRTALRMGPVAARGAGLGPLALRAGGRQVTVAGWRDGGRIAEAVAVSARSGRRVRVDRVPPGRDLGLPVGRTGIAGYASGLLGPGRALVLRPLRSRDAPVSPASGRPERGATSTTTAPVPATR